MDTSRIPVIIPAYEPDRQLINLLIQLTRSGITNIIVVDDGSGPDYDDIFREAANIVTKYNGVILIHKENCGKGRALKTAFSYILDNMPEVIGTVTADSDGQHTRECIESVGNMLLDNPCSLILGVRNFGNKDEIPWKSWFGNELTQMTFKLATGLLLSDTQTGLRGIPIEFMRELLEVSGERFEFETRMLIECAGRYPIIEVPIKTIYESKTDHRTHFKPIKDSLKIYIILFEKFLKYSISSVASFVIDIALFTVFCFLIKGYNNGLYIVIATVMARLISAVFNYMVNYQVVFKSKASRTISATKYIILAISIMIFSALFVTIICRAIPGINETIIKIIVDTVLFIVSYQIQKRIVFR